MPGTYPPPRPDPLNPLDLENLIKELRATLGNLRGFDGDLEKLLIIIHRKGWTTPPEHLFTRTLLQSMLVQTRGLVELNQGLMNAANMVGQRY